jgi:hypothetical protein
MEGGEEDVISTQYLAIIQPGEETDKLDITGEIGFVKEGMAFLLTGM